MNLLYDQISHDYADLRRPDPAIASAISNALDGAYSIVNVGAGTGSYEPSDKFVVAAEPSLMMIRQRQARAAPVVQATANALPFSSDAFDAALAILTVHHWPDRAAGLREMQRVSRDRIVLFTWDPAHTGFWLTDYLPEALAIDRPLFPSMDELEDILGEIRVEKVEIPHDCTDGFMCAYWRRPASYLDQRVRNAISTFSRLDSEKAMSSLESDLQSGIWEEKYGEILGRTSVVRAIAIVLGVAISGRQQAVGPDIIVETWPSADSRVNSECVLAVTGVVAIEGVPALPRCRHSLREVAQRPDTSRLRTAIGIRKPAR